jgi:cobalt-zinc-cadmium efflux system outer membrane protein
MAAMKRNLGRRVVLFSGMLTASVTIAQIVTANPLTVSEAVSEALKNNPELRGLTADMTAAKGEVLTARTFRNPELTIEPGVRQLQDTGGSTSHFRAAFALSQLFEFPGKRALKIALAKSDLAVRQIALEGFRFQLETEVHRAFFDLLVAEKIVVLRNDQVESAKVFFASSRERTERGYASEFETVKGQADLVAAQRAQREAEAKRVEARVTLNALLGRRPASPIDITGSLENHAPSGSRDTFRSLALARNPSLRTKYLEAEKAGLQLRATRFGRRPDFAIGPTVEYLPNEQTYGLSVTVALPLWDQKKGEIQTANAQQQRALADTEKAQVEIGSAVTKAAEKLEVANKELALYTPDLLAKLKGFVAQAEKQYAQSTTSLIIYLDAKKTYFDTLADYYGALGNLAAVRTELEAAVGVPLETQNRQ